MRTALACLCLAAVTAQAEPRMKSAEECVAYADLALVALTLARHGIDQSKTETMLPDMYDLASGDAQAIARRIVETAYGRSGALQEDPRGFATRFAANCLRSQGNLEVVLGVRL